MSELADVYLAILLTRAGADSESTIQILQKEHEDPVFEPLFMALEDEEVYIAIIDTLADLSDERVVPTLIEVLKSLQSNFLEEFITAAALVKIIDGHIVLKNPQRGVQIQLAVVEALAKLEDEQVVPALIEVLESRQSNDEVQLAIINALVNFEDQRIVPALIEVLESTWNIDEVRIAAVNALVKLEDECIVPGLTKTVKTLEGGTEAQIEIINSLIHLADEQKVKPILVEKLGNADDVLLRLVLIEALAKMQEPKAVKPLLQEYELVLNRDYARSSEEYSTLQRIVEEWLGDWAIEALIDSLDDAEIADRAKELIGGFGENALHPLVAALPEKSGQGFSAVASLLIEMKAFVPLINALDTDDDERREEIVDLLLEDSER